MAQYGNFKNYCACWLSKSSSKRLLLFIIPLVVVTGFVSFLGPKITNLGFMYKYHPRLWTSSSSNESVNSLSFQFSPPSDDEKGVLEGLRSTVVVMDVNNMKEPVSDDSLLINRSSSSPPLEIQAVPELLQQSLNETKEEYGFNVSMGSKPLLAPLLNESNEDPFVKSSRRRRDYTHLEKLEARLTRARSTIRESKFVNQTFDHEYIPNGPMYWNAKAFHRSYLEMEKQFKIFVYPEGEPPLFHNGPCKSIYSMEGNFIHEIELNKQFRTKDPNKAHVFFLPFSVTMLVRFVYNRSSRDFRPIRQTVVDYVNIVSTRYPFWNRSAGADHFMLSCHDWGPETSYSVPNLGKNSIRVLCNANTSEGFKPTKDVSFPEINLLTGAINGFVGGPSASRRPILAFFAGGLHGPIRPILLEHWANKDEDMKIQQYLPKGVSYYEMMRKTKYCICPSGYEVASPRVVEAIYTGCVPVLISDHYVPPFSDVLNWKSFSVEVPVSEIPNLKKILMSISSRQYIRMQRRVVHVRRHFEVHSPPKRFDVFHMILHSVWLRRLNVKVHDDQ